jgi:hypothetical protein
MTLQKARVVMLPTEDATDITRGVLIDRIMPNIIHSRDRDEEWDKFGTYQHLYITTANEIKEGTELTKGAWYINTYRIYGKPFINDNLCNNGYLVKIIAATDPSLKIECDGCNRSKGVEGMVYTCSCRSLPSPSQAFIEKYCKLGGIDEIDVEYFTVVHYCAMQGYNPMLDDCPACNEVNPTLKINSRNEISIHSIKDSWTRDEVINICKKVMVATNLEDDMTFEKLKTWMVDNL